MLGAHRIRGSLATRIRGSLATRASLVAAEAQGLSSKQLTVTPSWIPAGNNNPGSTVVVKVQYKFTLGIPLVTTTSVTVASTSQMVISQ